MFVADSSGRAMAKRATNHQYPGLRAAPAVMHSPATPHTKSTRCLPTRSASAQSGSANSEAARRMAMPTASVVSARPARAVSDDWFVSMPKALATLPSAAVEPNWP